MIAFLSEGVPPAAVYLVRPLFIAAIAASLMCWGVSKSGSPAPMAITSLPSAFSLAALADTARVGEGLMALRRSATSDMAGFPGCSGMGLVPLHFTLWPRPVHERRAAPAPRTAADRRRSRAPPGRAPGR